MNLMEEKYRKTIELLEHEIDLVKENADESLKSELESLVYMILGEIKGKIDIPDIEKRLQHYQDFDIEKLNAAYEFLNEAFLAGRMIPVKSSSGKELSVEETLTNLRKHLDILDTNGRKLGPREVLLRIELFFNGWMENALMCLPAEDSALNQIKALVDAKLGILSDDDLMILWANVQREFASEFDNTGFPVDEEASKFLQIKNVSEVREKLSYYLISYRQKLKREAIQRNETVWLQPNLGAARILTIRDRSDLQSITYEELNFLRVLSRLVTLWQSVFYREKVDLIKFLNLEVDCFVYRGEEKEAYVTPAINPQRYTLLQLKKLINYAEILGRTPSLIEEALWIHKLGLEVTLPESRADIVRVNEVTIQKRLCKFLIENKIQAFGTQFGQSQVDLLLQKGGEQFLIETKKYTRGVRGDKIEKDLVQLQTYMSQKFVVPRGVLIIYNFTDIVICPPENWIIGRYYILPINLGLLTASRKERSLVIRPGQGDNLIHIAEVDAAKRRQSAAAKKTKLRRKGNKNRPSNRK